MYVCLCAQDEYGWAERRGEGLPGFATILLSASLSRVGLEGERAASVVQYRKCVCCVCVCVCVCVRVCVFVFLCVARDP